MDITGFVNDVIVGTGRFVLAIFQTVWAAWWSPEHLSVTLEPGAALPPVIAPPVAYLVVSVMALAGATLFSLVMAAPQAGKSRIIIYFGGGTVAGEWKKFAIVAVPFVALFALLALFMSVVGDLAGLLISQRAALAVCSYFAGMGYFSLSALVLLTVPQFARAEEK
ncbi:MAG: hypothetical protein VW547_00715 [Alphaproteobacteria bacterium]